MPSEGTLYFCESETESDEDIKGATVFQAPKAVEELKVGSELLTTEDGADKDEEQTERVPILYKCSEFVYEHLDFFKHRDKPSKWGLFGSILALAGIVYMMQEYYFEWQRDEVMHSTKVRPRTENDVAVIPSELGVMLFRNGNQFYDESYFRWDYRLRAIFRGDTDNDVHPRIYVSTTSAITCSVYGDKDNKYLPSRNATLGCLNRTQVIEKLQRMRVASQKSINASNHYDDIPDEPICQGSYGNTAYWFLELKLVGCDDYGEEEGITCKNSTQMSKLFSEEITADLVIKSRLSMNHDSKGDPGKSSMDGANEMWENLYLNIMPDTWQGIETFLQLLEVSETGRVFSSITEPAIPLVRYSHYTQRSSSRSGKGNTFITYYMRLSDEVEETTIQHATMMDVASNMGGSTELVWIFFGLMLYIPIKCYGAGRDHQRYKDHSPV